MNKTGSAGEKGAGVNGDLVLVGADGGPRLVAVALVLCHAPIGSLSAGAA